MTSASSLARVSLLLLSINFKHLTISALLGSLHVSRTLWRSSVDFSISLLLRSRSLSDNSVEAAAVRRRYLFSASLSSLLSSTVLSCSDNFSRSSRTCRAFSTWNSRSTTHVRSMKAVIHMTETVALNPLHFLALVSGTCIVCISRTGFAWRRLEHCSIPSQKVACMHVTEMIVYDLFFFNLSLAAISAMFIFGARNFH